MLVQWFGLIFNSWIDFALPILVFLVIGSIGLGLGALLLRRLNSSPDWNQWQGSRTITENLRLLVIYAFLLLGAFAAIEISALSADNKDLAYRIIGSLFVIILAWILVNTGENLLRTYSPGAGNKRRPNVVAVNVLRYVIIAIAALVVLSIWGAPVSPILIIIAVLVFVAGLALRDALSSYFLGLQISSSKQIKVGDFIKLSTGESGQVTSINWLNTQVRSLEENEIIIPNSRMARATVINTGRPLKQAKDPFHFNTRLTLKELTGLKARNLTELVNILKTSPDPVIYYHVHRFLEDQLYLSPEPANDFAIWVNSVLGNDILGERLASFDTFAFPNLGTVKQHLIDIIEDYLRNNPDSRTVGIGEEFHFIRSVSFILPTHYIAHDLRQFVEVLRLVTVDSIYFHIYESRLRLQKGTNDFSIWMTDSLGEKELGDKIANIDPYLYTLENLRKQIIEQVDNYIR